MALHIPRVRHIGKVYSPFSGQEAEIDGEPNTSDSTLLFVYCADAGEYAHYAGRMSKLIDYENEEPDIYDLLMKLEGKGVLVIEIDTDWNGPYFYGFAPLPDQETKMNG